MTPTRSTESDCEEWDDPGIGFRESAEEVEDETPDYNEEEDCEEENGPGWGESGGPEVGPVSTCRGGEPVVLDDDHYEEPLGWISGVEQKVLGEGLTMIIFRRRMAR